MLSIIFTFRHNEGRSRLDAICSDHCAFSFVYCFSGYVLYVCVVPKITLDGSVLILFPDPRDDPPFVNCPNESFNWLTFCWYTLGMSAFNNDSFLLNNFILNIMGQFHPCVILIDKQLIIPLCSRSNSIKIQFQMIITILLY